MHIVENPQNVRVKDKTVKKTTEEYNNPCYKQKKSGAISAVIR